MPSDADMMSGDKPKKLVESLRNSLLDLQTEINVNKNNEAKREEVNRVICYTRILGILDSHNKTQIIFGSAVH